MKSLPRAGRTLRQWLGRSIGVHAIGRLFGQEHGDLGLQRVGVLHFVDEEVGVAVSKVVACGEIVPEQITGEDEHVEEFDFAGGPPFGGVIERKALQQFEDRDQLRRLLAFDIRR